MRYVQDGRLQVHLVESIADIDAPTDTELAAGENVTRFLRALNTPLDGTAPDASDPTSRYNKTVAGNYGGQPINAQWYRDTEPTDDVAYDALPRETVTNVVICRRGGTAETFTDDGQPEIDVGDFVEVWPDCEVITRNPRDYGRNEVDGFTTELSVGGEPAEDVAIVAGT